MDGMGYRLKLSNIGKSMVCKSNMFERGIIRMGMANEGLL